MYSSPVGPGTISMLSAKIHVQLYTYILAEQCS